MSSEQDADQEIPRVEHSAEVEQRWRRFRDMYDDNRVVIENRWIAMNKQKMRGLLSSNWRKSGDSAMPQEHRPDLTNLAPWRSATEKDRPFFPIRRGNENHLRWPYFNLEDLADREETFLWVLKKRASEHPREFAPLDHFRENFGPAKGLKLVEISAEFKPGVALVKVASASMDGDEYGMICYPEDDEEFRELVTVGLRFESTAIATMVNQRRIYHFLEEIITDIMAEGNESFYKCEDEHVPARWEPEPPSPADATEPQFGLRLQEFTNSYSRLVPYRVTNETVWDDIYCIAVWQAHNYAKQLQSLKTDPGVFHECIRDMREISHHDVRSWPKNESHPWAAYDENLENSDMFGTYLMGALYSLTEGFEQWLFISRLVQTVKIKPVGSKDYTVNLWYVLNVLYDRLRLDDLRTMLACSSPLGKYFRNKSPFEASPDLESGLTGTPAIPENHSKVASLVSLVGVMKELKEVLPHIFGPSMWQSEILKIIQGNRGGSWMSNIVVQKVWDSLDAGNAYILARNTWERENLAQHLARHFPDDDYTGILEYPLWENHEYLPPLRNLRKIDPKGQSITSLVSKHMIPCPDAIFNYPSTATNLKSGKRRQNAAIKRDSEANLKALWEDLQPFLEAEGALSTEAIEILNYAIPNQTAENGDDITPDEPPAHPQSHPPAGPKTPPRPTGTPGSAGPTTPIGSGVTTTPTHPLEGLSIKSPANRPPPVRTPERKTANDGVKKYSPIRRARPDEDQPRRRNFEPMRRRADRQRPVPAVPIAGPAPPAAPGPVREYPKIELPREQYELLRKLMVTDNQGRPGGIVWEDVVTLFQEMGFELRRGLRNSRGALDFFHPTDELVASQGLTGNLKKPMSRDRPHGRHLDFMKTRDFVRGDHGLGKYNWEFDHFKEAGT